MLPFLIFMIIIVFILPVTFLIVGVIYSTRPPKKINSYSGYRTPMSMKNYETWEFAHKALGSILLFTGVAFLLVAIVTSLLFICVCGMKMIVITSTIEVAVQLVGLLISCLLVERTLKNNFDEDGIRK